MGTILSSWKEIAQYLGKGVRTVQRWETEYALPVRRPENGHHKAVLAIPEEIDAWVRRQKCTVKETPGDTEIQHLRQAVTSLQAENAALRLQLNALIAEAARVLPPIGPSPSVGNGGLSPSPNRHAVVCRTDLKSFHGGKRLPAGAPAGTARNSTADSRAGKLLVEDVERLLREG